MFSQFCHAKSAEGEQFNDEDVINHMLFLLMAAHDTITSAASNLLYFLGTHPQWLQSIRDEVEGLQEAQVSFANLEKLPVLEACFNEALRLYPPVPFIPRRTVEEAEFKGFKIPAKTVTYLNPLLVHRLPEYWKDPMAFDPGSLLGTQRAFAA